MKELYILLSPNKEHKKVFHNVLVMRFWNGKSFKDYLVRATLPILNQSGRCELCWRITCFVCDSISTATTFARKVCQEIFKTQSGPLVCGSEIVLYLLKWKVCDGVPYVRKAKMEIYYRFNNYKSKHRAFKNGNSLLSQWLQQQ